MSNHISESSQQESEFALQLLFDRVLKIATQSSCKETTQCTQDKSVRPLTAMAYVWLCGSKPVKVTG